MSLPPNPASYPLNTSYTLSHRKDIQGLRAIAILLVIGAHADIPWLAGGFIGVDVFFVLSGYLITGLLTKELQATGTIQFSRFYARRFKRLLPALALVIVSTAVLASQMLPSSVQVEQALSASAAILWLSNIFFAWTDYDYFDHAAVEDNLFLHTWSLGVEEQFYLVWPLMLMGLFWLSRDKAKPYNHIVVGMLAVLILSFLSSLWITYKDARIAFYVTPFRAWQFAFGALAFLASKKAHSVNTRTIVALSWASLALIIGSAIALNKSLAYPGAYALLPTVGTTFLLFCGEHLRTHSTNAALQHPVLQHFGNISYSWYLWHWPVLILGSLILPTDSMTNTLLLILASWALAITTYNLVENPIRSKSVLTKYHGWQIFAAACLMIVINSQTVTWHNHQDRLSTNLSSDWYSAVKSDLPKIYKMGCDDWYHSSDVKICQFGSNSAKKTAVLMGDSIGLQWFPAFHKMTFPEPEWRLLVITKSACPIANEPFFYPRIGREYKECSEWRQKALSQIRLISPDILIFGSAETYGFNHQQWQSGTTEVLDSVSPYATKIFIMRSTPQLSFDGPKCLAHKYGNRIPTVSGAICESSQKTERTSAAWHAISDAASGFDNTHLIDLQEQVCPNRQCAAYRDGLIIYRDKQHLTATFVRSLSTYLQQIL